MRGSAVCIRQRWSAFTILEMLAALTIATLVAVIGIRHLVPAGDTSKQSSCDVTRQLLQNDVDRYFESTGLLPRRDLRELRAVEYSGTVLPVCPTTGDSYSLDANGSVECPSHEATRNK